jgi:serine/threonine protein kinase
VIGTPLGSQSIGEAQNEIRAIDKLCSRGHPNIIHVFGHRASKDFQVYIIDMELCDFALADYINANGEMTDEHFATGAQQQRHEAKEEAKWYNICAIMNDICEGLSFIHRCGEIHRDLKPGNSLTPLLCCLNT